MKKDISIPENLQSEIKWMTDWREAGLKDKELHELHLRNKLFVRRLIKRKKKEADHD
ncbi:MAG: hypothetical protein FWH12_02235 [Treponema sp.]|nr:hypothetical protein [Treponema sp.]